MDRYNCVAVSAHLQWYIVKDRDSGLGLHKRFRTDMIKYFISG